MKKVVLMVVLVVCVVMPVSAMMRYYTMLELAEKSDVVFVGKVTVIGEETASVAVDEVFCGKLSADLVLVTPVTISSCTGRRPNLSIGEQVLIFGNEIGNKHVTLTMGGQGKRTLVPESRKMELQALSKLLAIAPLVEHKKNEAMLTLVRSQNERLRSESRSYIISKLSYSELREEYKDDLVALIMDDDPELQRTGLQALRFVKVPTSIPRIVELTHGENPAIVSAASMALGQYDTEESVAALIALTKHENAQIKIRACIDIDRSRRPEAKEALKQLLDDADPKVRARGPRGLVYWLRRNEADDVLPRLIEMLEDEDPMVRASAADKLGECRNTELVPPLLGALRKETKDENIRRSILNALYCHYSKGDAKAKELIDKDLGLIIDALKKGGPHDNFGPSFQAVGILGFSSKAEAGEALKWAADSHPNKEIRAYAERCLSRR